MTVIPTAKMQAAPENPLDKELKEKKDIPANLYSAGEKEYLDFLQSRLQRIQIVNDQKYPEFNNKTRLEILEENEKLANTNHLDAKVDPDDVTVSAGIVEQKLDALLAHINNLNLEGDIFAFDKNDNEVVALGRALEDIVAETKVREGADGAGDEEKRMERQRALLKQPAVFVQEEWCRRFEIRKRLKEKFNGNVSDFTGYDEALELVFEGPSSRLLYMPNVYLGDMTEFYMEDQPDLFVMIHTDYKNARAKYGKFERFQYVEPGRVDSSVQKEQRTIFDNKWRLTEVKDNQVEVILYQCKERDEFQIIINGVPMLPIGFPLSAVVPGGGYNIAKQVFRIINSHFAYGKAFVQAGSVKELSKLIDEMLKLFVLKERKSITPAYINTSGRVISRKVLSPGRISMGIDEGSLKPIEGTETQGITQGEAALLTKYEELINKATVSEQFTGQQAKSGTTATETLEVSRQARLTLGLAVAACALLEKKLTYLRLNNILANWFSPTGETVEEIDGARKLLKKFRRTTRSTTLPDAGRGERRVIVTDQEIPSDREIRGMEREAEKVRQRPVEIIYINAPKLLKANVRWNVVVNARERDSSPFFKMLFREMLTDVVTMMNMGSKPNLQSIEERFGQVYEEPRNKFFEGRLNPQELSALPSMPNAASQERGTGPGQSPAGLGAAATAAGF